jgi:two-component system NarL family response regulator
MNFHVPPKTTVLLADDHALLRLGVATVINQQSDMTVVAEAGDGKNALALYAQHVPDVALVDLQMPGMEGVELIEAIRAHFPHAKIIILTTFDTDDDIDRGLHAGAKAFLLKDVSTEALIEAIRQVQDGKTVVSPAVAMKLAERVTQVRLTARELSVLKLVVNGKANKEIADELFISQGTVKVHLTHVFDKLGVASRTEAIASAFRRGLVRLN